MTINELRRIVNQEKFDVDRVDVVVLLGGRRHRIESVVYDIANTGEVCITAVDPMSGPTVQNGGCEDGY